METDFIQIALLEANTDDAYLIRKCNKDCLPVYYPSGVYNQFIDSSNYIVIVAKHDNTVIGYIIGENNENSIDRFHIISFGVLKEYRKNKIGTHLMNKIIILASKRFRHIRQISLYVMVSNKTAISFYKSIGFNIVKIMKNYYESFNQDGYLLIKEIY